MTATALASAGIQPRAPAAPCCKARWRREEDAARDAEIRRHGYHVEYVTKDDLETPDATRARLLAVRHALLARQHLP